MDNSTLMLLLAPLLAIQLILTIAVVVSIARKPLPWGEKWPWLLLLLANPIGPVIYFVIGSGNLDEKAANYQETKERSVQ